MQPTGLGFKKLRGMGLTRPLEGRVAVRGARAGQGGTHPIPQTLSRNPEQRLVGLFRGEGLVETTQSSYESSISPSTPGHEILGDLIRSIAELGAVPGSRRQGGIRRRRRQRGLRLPWSISGPGTQNRTRPSTTRPAARR